MIKQNKLQLNFHNYDTHKEMTFTSKHSSKAAIRNKLQPCFGATGLNSYQTTKF